MMKRASCTVLAALIAIFLVASPARADGLIVPFVGGNWGGDAGACEGLTPCSPSRVTYGVGIGFMVGGVLGFEGEFGYAPHFFGEGGARSDNYVLTTMANILAGVPLGPVRPYAVFGVGVLHTDVSRSDVGLYNAYANNSFAYNAGGGLMAMFSTHVGLRGDFRYMRTTDNLQLSQFDVAGKQLRFWRGSGGVVFRF